MSSITIPRKSLDPAAPSWMPSTNPYPRRVLIGTEEHKVRVTSVLLPDSPFASTAAPNNQVFIPRLNGGRQLHIQQMEPAWLTGIHGLPKPEQAHLPEAHWHKRHTALRALNLTKDLGRPVEMSRPASRTINVESDAFEADPAKPKYIPRPYVPSVRRAAARELKPKPISLEIIRSIKPQSMASENDLDITQTSSQIKACGSNVIHQADIAHQADTAHQAGVAHQNYASNDCICASGGNCPHQGSAGNYKEDKSSVEQNRFNKYPKKETHYQGAMNQRKSEESEDEDSINLNKYNKFLVDEADHEGSLNQNQFRGSLADMDQYSFPARGPDHKKPVMYRFKKAAPKPQNKKETSLDDQDGFGFPHRRPGYKGPTVSKTSAIADDGIETTYEDAIAETLAILTRNEIKRACPPESEEPTPKTTWKEFSHKFFGNILMTRKQRQRAEISLEEQDAPKSKHYEGCILCTPPASPRTSEEDIGTVAFGLSKQNPGPPPSSPPPFPNSRERSYQAADARRSTLLPAGVRQLEVMFDLPDGTRSSNQSIFTNVSQPIESGHGPYSSQSYHDGYNTSLNRLARPSGRNEKTSGSQDDERTEPELQYSSNLPPSGSTELLTGANIAGHGRGRRQYPHYNAHTSRNPDSDQVISSRRGSIFNRRISVIDLESGIRRFSVINRPMLPVDNSIIRLPNHHANGANIMPGAAEFEMVDLTDPGPPMARLEVSTQSRPRRVMQAMVDFLSTIFSGAVFKVRNLWKWLLVQKWAIFLLSFMFCITVALIA